MTKSITTKQGGPWARCRKCGDYIKSWFRHDFVRCYCGAIFIDGGGDYTRYGGNPADFENVPDPPNPCTWCGVDKKSLLNCDCEERRGCDKAGEPGHGQCGAKPTCGCPKFLITCDHGN